MERRLVSPRPDWKRRVEAEGMLWHTASGITYWHEGVYYRFREDEIDAIETATQACHDMAVSAVGAVIDGGELPQYGYTGDAARLIEESWRSGQRDIYGRIDFACDGRGAIKMLEYNGDTPTSLLEAAVVQWSWMTDVYGPGMISQFNDLHNAMVERMRQWQTDRDNGVFGDDKRGATLHVSCVFPHEEDTGTVAYIESVARESGLEVKFVPISAIGYTSQEGGLFLDQDDLPIRLLFKLYPWDWLLADDYGPKLAHAVLTGRIQLFEPAWKMLLSNKQLMVKMWDLNPGHPNLLETCLSERIMRERHPRGYVRKPVLGREGQNVSMFRDGDVQAVASTQGHYGDNNFVCQQLAELFVTRKAGQTLYAQVGSWIIGGKAMGMGIRESDHAITDDKARFVPHHF